MRKLKSVLFATLLIAIFGLTLCGCTDSDADANSAQSNEATQSASSEPASQSANGIDPEFAEYLKDYDYERAYEEKPLSEEQWQTVLNCEDGVIISSSNLPADVETREEYSRCAQIGINHWYVLPGIVEDGTEGDYCYSLHKDNKVEITKYMGKDTAIKVPNKIAGYDVAYIGSKAFAESEVIERVDSVGHEMKTVTLPDTVVYIGYCAFYGCAELESINLGNSLVCIAQDAFCFCKKLNSIDFPQSLEFIGADSFEGTGLTAVMIPSSVKFIDSGVFSECENLKNFSFQGGKQHLGNGMVCESPVEELYISANTTFKKGYGAFAGSDINKVEYAANMDEDTEVFAEMYRDCQRLTQVKLANNTTKIGEYAFQNCKSLKEIFVPASVKRVDTWAFSQCYLLKDIYFGSPDCDGLEEAGITGQIRTIHAPRGGSIEEFCNRHPLIRFVEVKAL